MARIFCILICLFLPPYLFSEEKKYGGLIYNTEIPNTLFLVGNIRNGDSFSLRKALRNHEISTIVLASPGGLVMEGLNMAGIIFDKGLNVYVPEKATCASSCAFMFFAGKERKVRGKLGVHQFYTGNASASGNINETENVVQFTVSEIIGFLNEFDTPRFVFERMFQQQEMYFFNKEELDQLMTTTFSVSETAQVSINRYLESKKKVIAQKEPEITKEEVVALLQKQLNEIGCNAGPVDGKYGRRTEGALKRFSKKAGLKFNNLSNINEAFLEKLSKAPKGYCPKLKRSNTKFASKYYMTCNNTKYPVEAFWKVEGNDLNGKFDTQELYYRLELNGNMGNIVKLTLHKNGKFQFPGDSFIKKDRRYFLNSNGLLYKLTWSNSPIIECVARAYF